MKIGLVSPYDFAYPGGVNVHILSLAKQFIRMGHDIRIIAPTSSKLDLGELNDKFIRIGTPIPFYAGGTVCRVTWSLTLGHTIKSVLRREQFDIMHLHEPFMPMLCTAVLRFSQVPNVATFHAFDGRPGYDFGRPVSTLMLKRRLRKLDGRIAVSQAAMDYAKSHVPGRYTIIPNGVDLKLFSPDVTPLPEFSDGKPNIVFVGRLEKKKGADYLIKAFKLVKQEIPDARLILVGPGTVLRPKYEQYVRDNDIRDVIFIGGKPQSELPRYYKSADVYCSPAIGLESFGIVLLEAMAVGKPVVATNIDGYREVVNDGVDGILVPPKDENKLAEALVSLLKNKAKRDEIADRGLQTTQQYSWEIVARKIMDYYLHVMEEVPWKKRIYSAQPFKGEISLSFKR